MNRLRSASGIDGSREPRGASRGSREERGAVRRSRAKRGVAMIVCVIMLFALIMATASAFSVTLMRKASAKRAQEADQASTIAEAGADCSLYELQLATDSSNDGIGVASGTMGQGNFAANITPAYAGSGQYTIRSIGTVNGLSRGVEKVVVQNSDNIGFFATNSVGMSGSGIIDSYNSTAGTYASQVGGSGYASAGGNVASNGGIALSGGAKIWGNASPGPGFSVTGGVGAVSGSTTPEATPYVLAPFTYSPPIPPGPAFNGSKTFTAGTYRYSSFTVPGGQSVTFQGNVILYVDADFVMSGSGFGTIAPGATLKIYQGSGQFTVSGGGIMNTDQKPKSLSVFSATASNSTVSGSAAFYGALYMPNSALTMSGSAGYYGTAKATSITISGGGSAHFDSSLAAAAGPYHTEMACSFNP
jgi:hypothetical protein